MKEVSVPIAAGWTVVDARPGRKGVNVLPGGWGRHGDHVLDPGCPCQPNLVRSGPLDEPIISHREPTHPGSTVGPE